MTCYVMHSSVYCELIMRKNNIYTWGPPPTIVCLAITVVLNTKQQSSHQVLIENICRIYTYLLCVSTHLADSCHHMYWY